ncbi:MAG: EAL domain-containing protein [Prochlorotrichaceae cyanobacterium]|jgi:diguanylate cyclase (GGDEF)-like protein/PAS domain S-box-containing protein
MGRSFNQLFIFSFCYPILLILGLSVLNPVGKTAVIWPAGGLLLGFLVILPRSQWGKILLIAYAIALLIEGGMLERSFLLITTFFMVNALESICGAFVFEKYCGGGQGFQSLKQLFAFLGIIVLGIPLLTAAIATTAILLLTPAKAFIPIYYSWYSSAGLGILFVTPCVVALNQSLPRLGRAAPGKKLEFLSLLFVTVGLSLLQFGTLAHETQFVMSAYLIFPVLIWAGMRYQMSGVTLVGLVWTMVSVWQVNLNQHPWLTSSSRFAGESWKLQLLMLVVALSSLSFTIALHQVQEALTALQDSEERYRGVVEDMPVLLCSYLPGGKLTFVNQAYADYFGQSVQALVGSNFLNLIPEDDRTIVLNNIENLTIDAATHTHEHLVLHPIGELRWQRWTNRALFDAQGQIKAYQAIGEDVTQLKRSEEQLKHLAHHDPLTDLPNRLLLNAQLEHMIQRDSAKHQKFAVIFIDLDRFKQINDSLGHERGDLLLQQLSQRITALLRPEDIVARISGDEFIVLLDNIQSSEDVIETVTQLVDLFKHPFFLGNQETDMTASLGISLFPNDGNTAAILLRNADAAMYQAKEKGRNTYCFYAEDVKAEVFEQALIENALRGALKRQEFFLVYQPQVVLQAGQAPQEAIDFCFRGMEVLLRWQHPELGLVSPGQFIPLAEQSGLIRDIGLWVLQTACWQGKTWLNQGFDFGHLAVNIAGPQIQHRYFAEEIQTVLKESGLPAQYLQLEITESFVMQNPEERIEQLQRLRDLGIEISIDDFGTGYSSLSYLKQLPIDKLKIDQSFVRDILEDPNDMAIAEAIIALGQALNLEVIAEGVEMAEQVHFLISKGCYAAQGYFFSKPLRSEAIEQLWKSCNFV